MPIGVARITGGVILTVVLALFLLRGAIVFAVGTATDGDAAFLAGNVVGMAIVALLLVLVIRGLVVKGFMQRQRFLESQQHAGRATE